MEDNVIKASIEAILFAAGESVPASRIAAVLGVDDEKVFEAAKVLADEYSFNQRGIRIVRIDSSLQMCSAAEYSDVIIHALEKRRPPKLSQPALEVLAICAYFQPVTRAYVEQVRGVDCSYTMSVLLERGLIERTGQLDVPGRPALYSTTEMFLRTMGISELSELPKLPDMGSDEGTAQLNKIIEDLKSGEVQKTNIEE